MALISGLTAPIDPSFDSAAIVHPWYAIYSTDGFAANVLDDWLFMTGEAEYFVAGDEAVALHGFGGDDTLYGGDGDDRLDGGADNDFVSGGKGDDLLAGGSGDDILYGGEGNDTIWGDSLNGCWVPYASTSDLIYAGSGDDTVYGGQGDDEIWGHFGDDTLMGQYGDDWINGGLGTDYIYGGQGDDIVYGGSDNDIIYGGSGSDLISGGLGDDELYGANGAGDTDADTFVFASGADTIWDYETGIDRIRLSGYAPEDAVSVVDSAFLSAFGNWGYGLVVDFGGGDVLYLDGITDIGDVTFI